ncbi:MAG TPA: 16S rRNA (guanine(966)-N(2))-methyltransferase RsmD [Phycisphaerales bacterium]|nr:16S rRNA (guanine(966)-N(2))-methyltransferase RsmD [Phycisphaerales bacterium]HRQ75112.1 16S rRNA (guanine(966)-N(2))-methyltransferase RsmD [Phycisphaerales bacterium]
MPRIIAGEYRSRRLVAPDDDALTRPYTDRVKESVFNLLRGWFDGARVLDLFAGVGTMGLETVSRGAAKVLLVEQNRKVFKLLEDNIHALGCGDRAEAMLGDALGSACLLRAPKPVDIVFIDPPYEMMKRQDSRRRILGHVSRCTEVMGDHAFIVLRSPIDPEGAESFEFSLPGLDGPEVHKHGSEMWVLLYQPTLEKEARRSSGIAEESTG